MSFKKLIIFTLFGLACCFAFTYFVRVVFGAAGPYAAMLSYPLYALVSWPLIQRSVLALIDILRHAALKDVQGRFYSYRGIPIKVIEGTDHCRWVPTSAIRKIAGTSVTDAVLARLYPSGWQLFDNKGHLREDALMAYLATASAMEAVRFKNWAQKNIVYPAQINRHQLGVKIDFANEEEQ